MDTRTSSSDERPFGAPAAAIGLPARSRLLMLAGIACYPAILAASLPPAPKHATPHSDAFLIYYGSAPQAAVADYRIAVLDSEAAILGKRNRLSMRLSYLSLGQVHRGRSYQSTLDREGLLFEADPDWPDARFIDLRSARWRDLVVDQLVPAMLAKGFRGVFLDTLDSAEALEQRDPQRFAGMVEAAAGLVIALRRRFPRTPIMINRGFAVLPRIVGRFDMLLGESVSSTFDQQSKRYHLVAPEAREWQVSRMLDAKRRDPSLRLFALDYWDPDDPDGISRLYALERMSGFTPYVATPDLSRIVMEQ